MKRIDKNGKIYYLKSKYIKLKNEHNNLVYCHVHVIYKNINNRDINGMVLTLSDCISLKYYTQIFILKKLIEKCICSSDDV